MFIARFRRLIATQCIGWCIAGILLSALQPFLFTHFRQDGWEDEPGFRVRNAQTMSIFSPDDRASHRDELETTLYVPAGAHLESPRALQQGLDLLMALVSLLLPLAVVLLWRPLLPESAVPKPIRQTGRAPPPTAPWRTQPPPMAPPLTT